ncbi:hypothetical protein VI817_003599 [Penicillium citrinum]|nr:hypothetical protein VI817_003599 [Penicillium citrinum]
MTLGDSLVIAFFYEDYSLYRSLGYSFEECAELHHDETIKAIERSLTSNGYKVVSVGDIKQLVKCLARGEHRNWDLAFSLSEGIHGSSRETQVLGLLEAYQIPTVFSDAATQCLSLDKAKTKMILEHFGIATAPFIIIPASQDVSGHAVLELIDRSPYAGSLKEYPLFVKPACEGSSKGIYSYSKINDTTELIQAVKKLKAEYATQSLLLEKFLPGKEYTVSILGTGSSACVFGTLLLDWEAGISKEGNVAEFKNTEKSALDEGIYDFTLKNISIKDDPSHFVTSRDDTDLLATEKLALQAYRALECHDVGRVDIRWADGKPYVLEINPLPGMRPNFSSLTATASHQEITHEMLIGEIIDSALDRYPHLKAKCQPMLT